MVYYIICAVVGYLIGSIPFGYIIVKLRKGIDIRTVGSGNIGATNVGRVAGWPWGVLCFLFDLAKGYIGTIGLIVIMQYSFMSVRIMEENGIMVLIVLGGLSIILGNIFPIYIKFKGGKGVATGFGVFLFLAFYPALIAFTIWLISFVLFRYVSLASIMASISLLISPFFVHHMELYSKCNATITYEKYKSPIIVVACYIVAIMVILKHIPNIKRLIKGTEPKVSFRRKDS